MSELGLAVAVLAGSLAATYLFCLRPMRRGACALGPRRGRASGDGATSGQPQRDAEIAALRDEIAALRRGGPGAAGVDRSGARPARH